MRIGQIVKNRREELGMSQTDLAKLTGYSDKSAISRIESGENDVPRKKLALFAKALQLRPTDLLPEDEDLGDLGNRLAPDEYALLVAYRSAPVELKRAALRLLEVR